MPRLDSLLSLSKFFVCNMLATSRNPFMAFAPASILFVVRSAAVVGDVEKCGLTFKEGLVADIVVVTDDVMVEVKINNEVDTDVLLDELDEEEADDDDDDDAIG